MNSSASHRASIAGPGFRHLIITAAAIAAVLGSTSSGFAQSAADHAAQAHGRPIVNGHPVQPTPDVVMKRLRHHEQMLQSERDGSVRPSIAQPLDQPATPGSSERR